VLKFGSIVSLGMALFVLALTSSSLRAQGFSVNLDLAHFADSIVAAYKTWREGAHEDEVQRRKDSVAVLSAHMSRIAATKRNLADFLKDHPLPLPTDSGVCSGRKCEDPDYKERWQNSHIVKSQFEKLDRQISGLQDDLDDIDPTWAAKNPKLSNQLYRVGHGKGLVWATVDRHSIDVVALRKWLYEEADELEAAVREIKNKLPPP
jgi:hypothetical protein